MTTGSPDFMKETDNQDPEDRGYIMVMMGLLLIPLVVFTALAIDVSSWYSRATELQRTADAAALAGVYEMPQLTPAEIAARDVIERNGIDPDSDDFEFEMRQGKEGATSFEVCIREKEVTQFFAAVFAKPSGLKRCGTALVNLPLDIGSPQNYFGGIDNINGRNSTYIHPDQSPGYWASIEGPGTDAVQGDQRMPRCYGSGYPCTRINPSHDPDGHYYTLTVNAFNPKIFVQVFSPGQRKARTCNGQGAGLTNDACWSTASFTTHYQLYEPGRNPWDIRNNEPVASGSCSDPGDTAATGRWDLAEDRGGFIDQWKTLCVLKNVEETEPGRPYVLRVWTTGERGNGSNSFALRATATSSSGSIDNSSTLRMPSGSLPAPDQPSLAAWNSMSIVVRQDTGSGYGDSGQAQFFLAKVGPEFGGKRLVIELYDSAEGSESVTINTPFGVQQGCSWTSAPLIEGLNGTAVGSGGGGPIGRGGSGSELGDCIIPTRDRNGELYNGHLLKVEIDIPYSYKTDDVCDKEVRPLVPDQGDQGCWWSITYKGSGTITDATTWSARIIGDPVRLID